jgi:imidazolonepropionase-like amidohydrolase
MGAVDVGMRADLVLLDADPLENIANTKRIAAVISKGKLLTRNDLSGLISDARAAEARVQ